jgi:hypothetical protein
MLSQSRQQHEKARLFLRGPRVIAQSRAIAQGRCTPRATIALCPHMIHTLCVDESVSQLLRHTHMCATRQEAACARIGGWLGSPSIVLCSSGRFRSDALKGGAEED